MLIRNDLIQSKPNMEIDHHLENHKKIIVSHKYWCKINEINKLVSSTFILYNPYQSIKQIDSNKSNICILSLQKIGHPLVQQHI